MLAPPRARISYPTLKVVPLLTHHARVLALDLIGFGRTPEAGRAVGVSSQREMLHHFITEVVGRPAVLVGPRDDDGEHFLEQVSQGALCLAPQRLDFANVMVLRSVAFSGLEQAPGRALPRNGASLTCVRR